MSRELDEIKRLAGPYAREALEARQKFLELRLRQDPEIRRIFRRAAERIARALAAGGVSPIRGQLLAAIEAMLRDEAEAVRDEFAATLQRHLETAAAAGSWQSRAVMVRLCGQADIPRVTVEGLERTFGRINRRAVEAIWRRTQGGLQVSDRIWRTAQEARRAMTAIVQDAVASGMDAVKTARLLERYVRAGADTIAADYPETMQRLAGRVPKDLSYNALRLARTETTAAFGRAQIESAQAAPAARGIKYCLSPAHHIVDICDELARDNSAGLGPGVYPPSDPPPYPAHPNTMSYLLTLYEGPHEDFTARLKRWVDDPNSEPDLEKWYWTHYQSRTGI